MPAMHSSNAALESAFLCIFLSFNLFIISSIYVSKKLLIALGINSYAITVISVSEEPMRFKSESKSIIIGISDKNIKNAACAEYALILLAPALRIRYRVLL